MDLPTYTNIWRIEKRLYKLYDLRLPMPLPLVQIGVFAGVFIPWILMMRLFGVPFKTPWHVLYIVPPGVLTWLATRPVIEGKRLTEVLISHSRFLSEPRTWCRLTPIREPREVVVVGRVWRRADHAADHAAERAAIKATRKARKGRKARPQAEDAAPATAAAPPVSVPAGLTARRLPSHAPSLNEAPREPVFAESAAPEVPSPAKAPPLAEPVAEARAQRSADADVHVAEPTPHVDHPPAPPRLEPSAPQSSGKRALASGVRRPGAPADFWNTVTQNLPQNPAEPGAEAPTPEEPAVEAASAETAPDQALGVPPQGVDGPPSMFGRARRRIAPTRPDTPVQPSAPTRPDTPQVTTPQPSATTPAPQPERPAANDTPAPRAPQPAAGGLARAPRANVPADTSAQAGRKPDADVPEDARAKQRERAAGTETPTTPARPRAASPGAGGLQRAPHQNAPAPQREASAETPSLPVRPPAADTSRQQETRQPEHAAEPAAPTSPRPGTDAPAQNAPTPRPGVDVPAQNVPTARPGADVPVQNAPTSRPGTDVPAQNASAAQRADGPERPARADGPPSFRDRWNQRVAGADASAAHVGPGDLERTSGAGVRETASPSQGERERPAAAGVPAGAGAGQPGTGGLVRGPRVDAEADASQGARDAERSAGADASASHGSGHAAGASAPEGVSAQQKAREPERPAGAPVRARESQRPADVPTQARGAERPADVPARPREAERRSADAPVRARAEWLGADGPEQEARVSGDASPARGAGEAPGAPWDGRGVQQSEGGAAWAEALRGGVEESSVRGREGERPEGTPGTRGDIPREAAPTRPDIPQQPAADVEKSKPRAVPEEGDKLVARGNVVRRTERVVPGAFGQVGSAGAERPADGAGDPERPAGEGEQRPAGAGEWQSVRGREPRPWSEELSRPAPWPPVQRQDVPPPAPPPSVMPSASAQAVPPAPPVQDAPPAPPVRETPPAPRPAQETLPARPVRETPPAPPVQETPPVQDAPPPRPVRSGPASPVRPRPLPPPPEAPRTPEPAITPPDPEHEVTSGGLRRLFHAVGGGHGDADAEYEQRLQQPFQGSRHIVVLGCTGGAGQTVTALMLGHTFAQHNGEPVVAVDVNPGPGALARRTRSETNETLTGLITRADQIGSLTAMRRYTSQARSGLDVIAAGKNPLQALDDRDYALAVRTIDKFYSVTLLDAAAAVVARVLPYADQVVLVAPASADAPRAVAMTYEWLDGHGYADLRQRAVTVINGVSRRSMDDVEQAEAVARGRCRALVRIPWDDHLSMDRAPRNELKALRAPTRRAYLALAGVVAGGFADVPERYTEQQQEAAR
ncbi:TcpE family conjugal transfer membrane protein [Spirillospora sp. NPDC052269]